MRDVAKRAGVSQSTVSRVLSNRPSSIPISQETIERVLSAVAELGYYPNLTASSLRLQKSFMIAIMIADISNAFYHVIVRTVQDIAHHHNYDVIVANTDQLYENEKRFCQAMMRRPVDGIIMVPYHLTDDEIDDLLQRTGASIVALASHLHHPMVDTVASDDGQATYDAIRWLIEQKGHREIGYIRVPLSYPPGLRRYNAYCEAMQSAGLTVNPAWVYEGDFTVQSGERAMQHILSQSARPSVIVACNDLMAMGVLHTAQDRNVRVPDEIAIVGFDNIPEATLIRPNLTTIAQYPVKLGQQLAKALFERIDGTEMGLKRTFEIPLNLIERQST